MNERVRVVLVLGIALALTTGALLFLRSGSRPAAPVAPAPLASPVLAPGTVGGLLPPVTLRNRYGPLDARRMRPAVVFLVAADCGCVDQLRQVVADAAPYRLVTYVVQAGADSSFAETLAAQAGGVAAGFADENGELARAYRLHTPAALVLVKRDGIVTQTVAAVAPSLQLGQSLAALVA